MITVSVELWTACCQTIVSPSMWLFWKLFDKFLDTHVAEKLTEAPAIIKCWFGNSDCIPMDINWLTRYEMNTALFFLLLKNNDQSGWSRELWEMQPIRAADSNLASHLSCSRTFGFGCDESVMNINNCMYVSNTDTRLIIKFTFDPFIINILWKLAKSFLVRGNGMNYKHGINYLL